MVALTEGSAVIKWSSPAKNAINVTSDTSTFLSSTLFDFFQNFIDKSDNRLYNGK